LKQYTDYTKVDQTQLQIDIDTIKKGIGAPTWEDFQHLLKMERWGRIFTFGGFGIGLALCIMELNFEVNSLIYWLMVLFASIGIGVGNVSRWANVTHPILHGAYDKVPNIPKRYTSKHFANGTRRWLDWIDWIIPEAWAFEHNIMHHYHLGEQDDPDNVEVNVEWITKSKLPLFFRYMIIYIFAMIWKPAYYAPNTLRILDNKVRRKQGLADNEDHVWNPFTKNGFRLWKEYIFPYALIKFLLIPALFLPLGWEAFYTILTIVGIGELIANAHSFTVIVPNHSAGDIYRFETPHKTQGEFYLRQIMGSVNYKTGTDTIDFMHGWLNYQIEHHIFPNLPLSQYQKMQPLVKEICAKHNLEYRQESVFKRVLMTIELMVGNTQLLKIEGI